ELSSIAQFINGQTLFVAQVDLANLDVDRFGETLEGVFKQAIVKLGFPTESIDSSVAEFHKTAEALKNDVKDALKDVQEKHGVAKLYYVIQSVKGDGSCFIIPAQSMTEDQISSIKEFAEGFDLNCALYKKSFIIASSSPLKEIGAYYKNFQPAPNARIEAFFKDNPNKIAAFYSGRIKIRPLVNSVLASELTPDLADDKSQNTAIQNNPGTSRENSSKSVAKAEQSRLLLQSDDSSRNTGQERIEQDENRSTFLSGGIFGKSARKKKVQDPFEHSPRCIKNAVELFDSSFVEAYGYVDASTLSATASLKFSTSANAGKFRQEWANINDEVIPAYFSLLQATVDFVNANVESGENDFALTNLPYLGTVSFDSVATYRLIPLLREIVCGEARTHLPKQNGSQLTFNYSVSDEFSKIGPNTIAFMYFFRSTFSETEEEGIYEEELEKGKDILDPYIRQTEELNLDRLDELESESKMGDSEETDSASDSDGSNGASDNDSQEVGSPEASDNKPSETASEN
ncbi:MAG: hypothetical protein J6X44_06355, partial [Thermoguttaceae bacterium]|nr:hypothetical protein [Thermoguttaceae bacterium]